MSHHSNQNVYYHEYKQQMLRVQVKGNLYMLLVRIYISKSTIESIMEVSQKTKNIGTIKFSNTTPGHISKGMKVRIQ
jgi:hypothetical protein